LAQPTLVLSDPALALASPPPAPNRFLEPVSKELANLLVPPIPVEAFKLAAPELPPLPSYVKAPIDERPATSPLAAHVGASTIDMVDDGMQQSPSAAVPPSKQKNAARPALSAATDKDARLPHNEPLSASSAAPPEPITGPIAGSSVAATLPRDNSAPSSPVIDDLASHGTGTIAPTNAEAIPSPRVSTRIPLPIARPSTPAPPTGGIPVPIPRPTALPSTLSKIDPEAAPTTNDSGAIDANQPHPKSVPTRLPTGPRQNPRPRATARSPTSRRRKLARSSTVAAFATLSNSQRPRTGPVSHAPKRTHHGPHGIKGASTARERKQGLRYASTETTIFRLPPSTIFDGDRRVDFQSPAQLRKTQISAACSSRTQGHLLPPK
jgi:hypothetical protein